MEGILVNFFSGRTWFVIFDEISRNPWTSNPGERSVNYTLMKGREDEELKRDAIPVSFPIGLIWYRITSIRWHLWQIALASFRLSDGLWSLMLIHILPMATIWDFQPGLNSHYNIPLTFSSKVWFEYMTAVELHIWNNNCNITKSLFNMEYIRNLEAEELTLLIFAFFIYFFLNIFFWEIDLSDLLSI